MHPEIFFPFLEAYNILKAPLSLVSLTVSQFPFPLRGPLHGTGQRWASLRNFDRDTCRDGFVNPTSVGQSELAKPCAPSTGGSAVFPLSFPGSCPNVSSM